MVVDAQVSPDNNVMSVGLHQSLSAVSDTDRMLNQKNIFIFESDRMYSEGGFQRYSLLNLLEMGTTEEIEQEVFRIERSFLGMDAGSHMSMDQQRKSD